MSLSYETQTPIVLIGTKNGSVPVPVALTAAYDVANKTKVLEVGGMSKINFDILYTMGAAETANSIELRVEGSSDGINFYRIPNETVAGGLSTLTAREFTFVGANAAAATISIGLDIFYKYIKVSVKETGVTTNFGTIFVEATLSGE